MMGYAIVGGVGLALGIGLMIWALRERRLRYAAEKSAAKALVSLAKQRENSKKNAAAAQNLETQCTRMNEVITGLRAKLRETRKRLAQCGDPKAVESWLDDVLKGGSI